VSGESKLTSTVVESNVDTIMGGNCIFSIPYFQRSYKWNKSHLKDFFGDIVEIVEGDQEMHFLGAILLYARPRGAGGVSVYEVVDGQQRLTTISLVLWGLAEQYVDIGKTEEASELVATYLMFGKPLVS
jgi:uncharacterized protein with ParB-like and HNH nuclease domain